MTKHFVIIAASSNKSACIDLIVRRKIEISWSMMYVLIQLGGGGGGGGGGGVGSAV